MKKLILACCMLLCVAGMYAQGVTSSSINGRITDDSGSPLIGANVTAVHTPTGSFYGNTTDLDGYVRIANMRVGGPYTVTISYTGYEEVVRNNVFLDLGQTYRISTQMSEAAVTLEEIAIVSSRGDIFDGNRTGAETTVNEAQIAVLPTVARAIGDFARVTPQATVTEGNDGFSISLNGVNNRYNAIYIDGAVNNDVFGLAGSGTNGGQTGVSPFSVDAISEFQISLAPFDVRQGGFAGGAINAITRSGSNDFEGSVYTFIRNQNLAGKTPTDDDTRERTRLADFSANTTGFRLGGPLKKDKIFFFVNGEFQNDNIPLPFDFADYQGTSSLADLAALESKLNGFGYDPGSFTDNATTLSSTKFTGRLDFNLSQAHKLTLKHSFVTADNIEGGQSNARDIFYSNASEAFVTTTNTSSVELNSVIGSRFANNLIIGYTAVRDDRDPNGQPFPWVQIDDGNGADITFGSERFSTANLLNQDIFTLTNNFEIYKGKHTFTLGTHNEFYSVDNLFLAFNYGEYNYNSLNDFLTDQPAGFYQRVFSLVDNEVGDDSGAIASFTGAQFGFYVQDEIQVSERFKLTAGIRLDIPSFSDTPTNDQFNNTTAPLIESFGYDLQGARVGDFIGTQFAFSPRVGFNLDLTGTQTTQLRGGVGVFTSRVPLVWPGGAYNNYGFNAGFTCCFDQVFEPNINAQPPGEVDINNPTPNGTVDLFASDFKLPQVLKINAAVDHKLGNGFIANFDAIYNKTLQNVLYENVNLKPAVERLTGTGDDRNLYNRRDEIDDTYGRILLASNTSEGYTYNLTASIAKQFTDGFSGSLAYSFGDAFTIFDGTSSQNSSQWRGLHTVNGRNVDQPLSRSDFSQGHRVLGIGTYAANWLGESLRTTISLFYEGQSGRPYSYIYNDNGNLNVEDSRERSLIYVPLNQNDIVLVDDGNRTAAQQWADLDQFIESDPYLSTIRGGYAARNESRGPASHVIDMKLLQDFNLNAGGMKHTFQFSLDVFNFTNLLNKDWGRRRFVGQSFQLLDFEGFMDDTNTPTFTFGGVPDNNTAIGIDDAGIQSSRWQMQVGLRYLFGRSTPIRSKSLSNEFGPGETVPVGVTIGAPKINKRLDTDGDGVRDFKDACPNIAGLKKFKGCPMSEADMAAKAAAEEKARMEAAEQARMEAEKKAKMEAEKRQKAAAEAARKAKAEAEAKAKAEEEAKMKAAEEAKMKAEEEAKMKAAAAAEAIKVRNAEISRSFNSSLQGLKFNSSAATFKKESYALMDQAVATLNQYPDINILIQGHTDSQGAAENNRQLSQKRADAVRDYLVSKGIDISRVSTSGLGEEYPVADNNTAAGRALNRRVEFIIRNN